MKYRYGTPGFCFKIPLILEATSNIANTVCLLSSQRQKYVGIMITASHNDHTFNEVKIIDSNGQLLSPEDEHFCIENMNLNLNLELESRDSKIVIGHDTRPSSLIIQELLISSINSIDSTCVIDEIGLCTTPQVHFQVFKNNNNVEIDYYEYYFNSLKSLTYLPFKVFVDCAHGVGKIPMFQMLTWKQLDNIRLINTNTANPKLLNHLCGSDYVGTQKKIPFKKHKKIKKDLCASLDGDADRVIFYFQDNEKMCLLNGDRIMSLIIYYLETIIPIKEFNIGVVHTVYSNGNFLRFLKQRNITTECVATGVKHLHVAACKYDIGIYFETNGHGTILFNNHESGLYPRLDNLKNMCSQLIGDAICDFFVVLTILNELEMSPQDWYKLYQEKPFLISKVETPSQTNVIFETNLNESKLLKPVKLQTHIEHLSKQYPQCFIFVRPSGTESCLRYYIECQIEESIPEIEQKLLFYIQCCFS